MGFKTPINENFTFNDIRVAYLRECEFVMKLQSTKNARIGIIRLKYT